jgi:hypothetical protein
VATLTVGTGIFSTIQAAIDAAQAGDTVQIESGFSTSETTLTLRSSVSVTGQAGPAVYLDGGVLQVDMSKLPAPIATVDLSGLDVNAKLLSLGSLTQIETSAAHGLELDGTQIAVISNANATLTVAGGGAVNIVNADLTLPSGGTPASVDNLLGLEFAGLDTQKSLIPDNLTIDGSHTDAFAAFWIPLDQLYVGSADYYNLAINSSFVHLGNDYASYLQEGGEPLVDIIKVPANRAQSLHDNLLGNLGDGPIASRFINLGQSDPRTEAGADFGSRPFHNGNVGLDGLYSNQLAVSAVMAWDMSHGVSYPAILPAPYAVLDGVNTLTGTGADNYIFGGGDNDTLNGDAGNDTLIGGAGNDAVNGGSGSDTAFFSGAHTAYNTSGVSFAAGTVSGTISGPDGSDTLSGVEVLQFADGFHVLAGMSIQAAINAAHDGDTIFIAAGTFKEQLTIDGKHVTLSGARQDQTIILSPDAANLTVNLVDSSRGLPNQYSVVGIKNGADVTIHGLTIDGNDQGAVANGGGQFTGIYALNSDVVVDDVHVTKVDELAGMAASGNQRNHAIVADSQGSAGEHTITVQNSLIDLFQKTGIFVLGPTLTADIHDNEIVGAGPGVQAQNGIQIGSSGAGSGTDATVTDNTISGMGITGPEANGLGTAVLAFSAGSVSVNDNAITGTDYPSYGVAFVNTDAPVANGNTISSTSGALLDAGTINTPLSHAGNVYSDNDFNVVLEQDGSVGLTFSGSEGADSLQGGSGADTLSGLGGNDTIVGGSGVDTAAYTATISTSGITDDGAGHFVVATGGSEGTDTLSGVEKIDGAGTHNILLVGNGGYATIQAAVDAAADGDTMACTRFRRHSPKLIPPAVRTPLGSCNRS